MEARAGYLDRPNQRLLDTRQVRGADGPRMPSASGRRRFVVCHVSSTTEASRRALPNGCSPDLGAGQKSP